MDLMSGYKNCVQGVVGLVFGNENSASSEDSYVEQLHDRISNGVLAEDRRTAIAELQFVVTESRTAQLAFGAIAFGACSSCFPVLLSVLKEECDDVEMVRGALGTLVSALTPIDQAKALKNEAQPTLMNTDLFSREAESISLLLSLLFLLRLQETILTIPRGITWLMDMLMDLIRNEALLFLTYLTREAEEIQKILVFEGAFEKIFSIINEEGCSEGGVVVQDCLELLNNLIRNNVSNQVLLREIIGFDPLISILKLRGSSYSFTQQKTVNLLSALKTISLLIMGGPEINTGKDANRLTNKVVLVQKKVFDHLLMRGVESQWAPVPVRCTALRCIGDLIANHPKNLDALASKVLGEEPQVEPALYSILRIILRTSNIQEFVAANYVFKCFREKNLDGQAMLASTLIPQPQPTTHAPPEEDVNMSFGSLLLHGLTLSQNDGDLKTCSRAASVLSHVLKDSIQCKERVCNLTLFFLLVLLGSENMWRANFLRIELEEPTPSLGALDPLLHHIVKYLSLASCMKSKEGKPNASGSRYVQAIILKLLVIWLSDCPSVVQCFLDSRPHLTYLLEGLATVILGECVIYNKSSDSGKDAFTVVDAISQKPRKPLTRSTAASMAEIEDVKENEASDLKNGDHLMLVSMNLEVGIRESVVDVYSHPKSKVAVVLVELQHKSGESDVDFIKRLKSFVEKQCSEITLDTLKTEKTKIESEASMYCNLAGKMESNLKSLSDAYNSLEQANFHLEKEIKALKSGGATPIPDVEAVKAKAREEAQKESEVELNDLLVCLGQEQSKVEKLSVRLLELGEDVNKLLEGIGDDIGLLEDVEVEED
ncbi:hypothetical protein CsSME_00045025 [Camellia sinensis var. sinensis]